MTRTIAFDGRSKWRTVFHITHAAFLPSIREHGLLPCLARRKAKRTWLCDLALIPWALKHVCDTQGWTPHETAMVRVCVPGDFLVRHREGVFWSNVVIPPSLLGASVVGSQYRNKWPHGSVHTA